MAPLTQVKMVLDLSRQEGNWRFFEREEDEERDAGRPSVTVALDAKTYAEMGRPRIVTVTIVPGDDLN